MNYKIKKYYRLFILAFAIVIGIIFISVSVSAEEISDTSSSTNPSRQKSPEVLAADAEAMWRERLIQNGINPDRPLVNDSVAQLIQDGFVLQPLSLYPPISGNALGAADGVYAISNIGNSTAGTTFFMDTSGASYLPDRHMQQAAYTNTTPLTYFTVSSLFKLTQHPETGSYIIRLMTNNALSFDVVMNPETNDFEVMTKYIPLDDALVPVSDTYTITSTVNGGFFIRKYGTTRYVQTNESQGSGAEGAPGSYLSAADDYASTTARSRWNFHLYTDEEERNMLILKGADTLEAGKTSIITPVFYSTVPKYNILIYNFTYIPSDVLSIEAELDGGIMYIHFYKSGNWGFEVYMANGVDLFSSPILNTNWNVKAPFDEGVYFISNVEYEDKYVQINNVDNMNAPDTIIELHTLNGYDHQRWQVEHYYDGYYKIISEYSGLELTAPTGYGNYVVTQTNESSNSTHLWKFIEQSDGTYKISPQSNSNYFMTAGNTSIFADQDLEIRTAQSDGSDKWNMTRMLPTSGAELTYDESLWDGEVQTSTNCYAYAIDDQVIVAGLDPGRYANPALSLSGATNLELFGNLVSSNVQLDFQEYSRETGETYIFEEIEKYTKCLPGTYKVALIAGPLDEANNKWNYHWYRQDSDGLWSHKPGHTEIRRYDADDKPIIDPETCQWDMNYTYFVGFFAVTPWSNYA